MDESATCSGELGHRDEQRLVDKHFNLDKASWCEAYKRRDVFGEIYRGRQAVLLKLVDEVGLSKDAFVLEIGCGWGFLSLSLARRGFLVNAVDHASAMVEVARRQAKRAGMENRIIVSVEDVHKFSFSNDLFDLVVGLGVVPWLHDLKKALTELERVLKPGGYVALSIDNSDSTRLRSWLDFPVHLSTIMRLGLEKIRLMRPRGMKTAAREYHYSADEFERCLREAGFETLKYVGVGFGPFKFFGRDIYPSAGVLVHLKLQQYSERRFPRLVRFATQYVFLATKRTRATHAV